MAVKNLTQAEFKTMIWNFESFPHEVVFLGEKPALVDFYATWCGPCKMLAPVLEELSDELSESVDFYKIDTDKEQKTSAVFGIQSVPTLLFFPKNGKPRIVQGALPKGVLLTAINEIFFDKKENQ